MPTFTGDNNPNTLIGSSGDDVLFGLGGGDILIGGGGGDVLDGGSGTDFASYSDALSGIIASLFNPSVNTGIAAGDTYVSIEGLIGSSFNDTLIGDALDNRLRGGAGADILNGGDGSDFADYSSSSVGLTVDLSNPTVNNTGDAAGDTFISIEDLIGSAFNDTLVGDAGDNRLRGGAGADVLNGKDGYDIADYSNAAAGVRADLSNSASNTGDAAGDLYISIEALRGSDFNDVLIGDNGDNVLRGRAGADVLNGQGGFDLADYRDAATGVTVDMLNSANNTGDAAGDTLISIEALRGSAFNDTLVGDNNNNTLRGLAGADVLNGQGGIDYASYQDATSGVIADLSNSANNTGDAAGDTYISIEGLRGSAFNDTLIGDVQTNWLRGGGGADILNGGGGFDYADYTNSAVGLTVDLSNPTVNNTGDAAGDVFISIEGLIGSAFNDTLVGNAQDDWLRGGAGADVLNGKDGYDFADYIDAAGVTADLSNSANNTGFAAGDIYFSIEALAGSYSNDTLIGDAGDNILRGRGGADVLDGRGGIDLADYRDAASGVTVDMLNNTNNTGEAFGDTLISIENLRGSFFNDVLVGDNNNNTLRGLGGADVLNGQGGMDYASYQDATSSVYADLSNTANNTGDAAGDTYISIEGLRGGAFNDTLIGNNSDNLFRGGGGADVLNGQGGHDIAEYRNATSGIVVSLANSAINTGEAAGDTYISIEGLRGSDYSDLLVGLASGGSTLAGYSGSDVIYALGTGNNVDGGADTDALFSSSGGNVLNGGDGFDYVRYDYGTTGIFASLSNSAANTGAAAGDSYISVEALVGTSYADTLVGNQTGNELYGGSGADYIYGLGGNDLIFGGDGNDNLEGDAGADALDGGAGFDFARYDYSATGVIVVMKDAAYNTGEAAGDTYTSIEGVVGSSYADTIFGDDAGNQIYGQAGNDFLLGGGGADALFGGLGIDELRGDAGDDAFFFYASELQAGGRDVIDDFSAVAGNHDVVNLIGINPASVTYKALMTGTEIEIALSGGGVATIFLANASVDAVVAGSFFY